MGFWNYLGLACLLNQVFGKKNATQYPKQIFSLGNETKEDLRRRYDMLSSRIDDLESRLSDVNSYSEEFEDIQDEIEYFRDELDDIDTEQDMMDLDDLDDY